MGEFEILDTDEPLAKRMQGHAFDRLIMLSDGVFAIAITLAALEIHPPPHWTGSPAGLLAAMARPLAAYAISFAVIGVYWITHRRMVARLRRVDGVVTALNLALLAVVALQPLAVQVLMANGPTSGSAQLYFWQVVTIGVIQSIIWGYAAFMARLVDASIGQTARVFLLMSSLVLPGVGACVGLYIGSSSDVATLAILAGMVGLAFGRGWVARRLGV